MSRMRFGYQNNTFTPVSWMVECPIHSGVTNIEYPVAQTQSGTAEHAMDLYYCPSGLTTAPSGNVGGHTFRIEDANATVFDTNGNIAASGVSVQSVLSQF